jgi:multidrug resistance efflux pump
MITPLKKHSGQHGPLIALAVIAGACVFFIQSPHKKPLAPMREKPVAVKTMPAPPPVEKTRLVADATVGYAEDATAHVMPPVGGFVVAVPRTGRTVKRGAPLATIVSADVLLAERELIAQVQHFTTQEPLNNARLKLQRMGMPKEWIARVEQTGQPQGKLPLWAWVGGSVVVNQLAPGLYVEAMTELVTITDPTRRWVLVELDESDRARLTVGMTARLYIDGREAPVSATIGRITQRYIRFEFANPKGAIAPGTPVRVELDFTAS